MSILDNYKKVALSNKQILQLVKNKANVILYPDLWKYKNIDQLLYPYNACFLLFETKKNYGHWCALIKYGNTVEFFDPYSGYPDDVLQFIPKNYKNKSNQNYPYLTALLYNSPYNIEFNDHKYQKHDNNINTCGRHTATRILFKHYDLKQYDKFIKLMCKRLNKTPDDVVTYITLHVNGGTF